MIFSRWAIATIVLVTEATLATSSALLYLPSFKRYNHDLSDVMQRASEHFEGELERRSPEPQSGSLSLSSPSVVQNATTLTACTTALSTHTNVSNDAGLAACYNILDWHSTMGGMFQADLRLFQISPATGSFIDVPMNAITVDLTYPNSTQYSALTNVKRTVSSLQRRDSQNITQIQQFSLQGSFKQPIDINRLNTTELMSLLIPQITLTATSTNGTQVASSLSSSDIAYFVTGQFSNQATSDAIIEAANPAMAVEAISDARGFVIPGQRLGIFPVGLIVTATWTFLFILAYGLGTLGRMRQRDIYRQRVAATSGRRGTK